MVYIPCAMEEIGLVFLGVLLISLLISILIFLFLGGKESEESVIEDETQTENKESDKEYKCTKCANRGSPVCINCKTVSHPDGPYSRPRYYVFMSDVPLSDLLKNDAMSRSEAVDKALQRFLDDRAPLPLSLVMEFNKLHEREEE